MIKLLDSKYSKETFTVESKMDMTGLENIAKELVKSGYESCYYNLDRVIEGTRKKHYSLLCMKNVITGKFRAAS